MSQLTVNVEWPDAIPLPSIEYSAEPRNSTIESKDKLSRLNRRSRFTRAYATVQATWVLSATQWADLQTFITDTTHGGADAFKIELRYPYNGTLTEWVARIEDELEATHDNGLWKVSANLDLVNPVNI